MVLRAAIQALSLSAIYHEYLLCNTLGHVFLSLLHVVLLPQVTIGSVSSLQGKAGIHLSLTFRGVLVPIPPGFLL